MQGQHLMIIGLMITGVLFVLGISKKLRSTRTLITLLIFTGIIGGIGIWIRGQRYEMANGNAADDLLMPFAYMVTYGLLRKLYKRIYQVEPTYNSSSWYDEKEG